MRIAVIGCGIGGQAAAILLARDGHDVTVFERFPAAKPVGAGLLLQPSGLLALAHLGVANEVLSRGHRVERLIGRTRQGRRVMDISYGRDAFGLGVHRAVLFDALHRALLRSTARLKLHSEVEEIRDHEQPSLLLADKSVEGPFDLVIDAAGAHDHLRAKAGAGSDRLYPWGALWTICPDRAAGFTAALRQVYDRAHTMIGVLPVGHAPGSDFTGSHVAIFWSLKHCDYEAVRSEGLPAFADRLIGYWPELRPLLAEIDSSDSLALATYRDVRPQMWRHGRVLLLGDTAHGTSPQLGQGANLALIDAATLATALRSSPDVDTALTQHCRLRRNHVAYYQLMSRWLTPMFQSDSRLLAGFRDLFLFTICHAPVSRQFITRTLTGYGRFALTPWKPDFPSAG